MKSVNKIETIILFVTFRNKHGNYILDTNLNTNREHAGYFL